MLVQFPTAASMKITAFWDVTPCSLVGVYRRFRGANFLHHQGDVTEAVRTSEKSIYSETTRRYIPEGCNLLMFIFYTYEK
jgi:hypothetical protein